MLLLICYYLLAFQMYIRKIFFNLFKSDICMVIDSMCFAIPEVSSWEGKIFLGIIGFSWATYMWEEYLAFRQRRMYKNNETRPVEVKKIMDAETYEKARLYCIDKSNYGLIEGIFNQITSTCIMLYGGIPALWEVSGQVIEWLGFGEDAEITQTVAFISIASVINTVIALPFSWYFTFVIEEKHGFNKQTRGFFILDKLKKFVLSQLISAPVVAGLVYIIKAGGDYFFVYLWGFTMAVVFFFMTIYPDLIAPLFDKYEPLEEGKLKSRIERMAADIEFPLTKLYVVEGSKRSAHSNAYLYGFFKNKRIVLYDTLLADYKTSKAKDEEKKEDEKEENKNEEKKEDEKEENKNEEKKEDEKEENKNEEKKEDEKEENKNEEKKEENKNEEKKEDEKEENKNEEKKEENKNGDEKEENKNEEKKTGCDNDEVLAVLGHELGHWKLNHVVKMIGISQVNLLMIFAVFGSLYRYTPLYHAFGFHKSQPAFIGLILVMQYVFAPYNEVLGFLLTMLSRHNEFQADAFSKGLGHSQMLKSGLVKLNQDNLGFPLYDSFYSAWHNSHPPILERIAALDQDEKKTQ